MWSAHHLGLLLEAWNYGVELAWRARRLWLRHGERIRIKLKAIWVNGELFIKINGTFKHVFNLGICPKKPTQKFLGKVEKSFLNGFVSIWNMQDYPISLYI